MQASSAGVFYRSKKGTTARLPWLRFTRSAIKVAWIGTISRDDHDYDSGRRFLEETGRAREMKGHRIRHCHRPELKPAYGSDPVRSVCLYSIPSSLPCALSHNAFRTMLPAL
jgi:hypothetical protein